jgi:hypothetical protein
MLYEIFLIGMGGGGWNPKFSKKTFPSAALSTTNPTCCPDAKPGRRSGKPATNRFSYGTAFSMEFGFSSFSMATYNFQRQRLNKMSATIVNKLQNSSFSLLL